jgi:hypothetical protein
MRKPDETKPGRSRLPALAIIGGVGLLALALSRWDSLDPQSLICRHRDDPEGQIDFRVEVGQGDEVALGHPLSQDQLPGMGAAKAPLLIHPDRRHDVEHQTTIDRRALTFEENSLAERGGLGEKLIDGHCRLVASG